MEKKITEACPPQPRLKRINVNVRMTGRGESVERGYRRTVQILQQPQIEQMGDVGWFFFKVKVRLGRQATA